MELKDLQQMKVDELRAEAEKLEGVEGISKLKKQELIDLLVEKLGIQSPEASSEDKAAPEEERKPEAIEEETKAEGGAEAKTEETPPPAAEQPKEAKAEPKVDEHKPSPYKGRLKALQAKRKQALADRDYQTLADVRMRIKKYKRKIKKESSASPSP